MLVLSFSVVFLTSCDGDDDDDPTSTEPIASFTSTVDDVEFLKVMFTNVSQNATSYTWDFGDGAGTSTEENPTYTYATSGTYQVTLVASDGTNTDDFTASVTVADPDETYTLLVGETSKSWKLVRQGTAMLLASNPQYEDIYWEGASNNGQRPCIFDDTFTFHRDGTYTYDDAGTFWAEYGVFNNVDGCDQNMEEGCYDPTETAMVNACGDDVSAWGSGSHNFEFNSSTGKITLTGTGAWIGIPKLGTDEKAVYIPGSEALIGSEVTAMIPHINNSLLIFQKNGNIYRFKDRLFQKWETPISEFLRKSAINSAILLKNNTIAIGTQNSGLIVISPQGQPLQQLIKDRGLSNRTVLSLYEDQFQNLWVGLNNGLCMIELSSPFNIIDEKTGLPGTGYCGLKYKDRIYLGTSNGLFYQNANPNPLTTEADYQLIENTAGQVYNIQQINDQLLLSHHRGAFLIENNKADAFYTEKGTWKFEPIPGTSKIIGGTYEGFITLDLEKEFPFEVNRVDQFKESSRVFQLTSDTSIFMTHGYKGVFKLSIDDTYNSVTSVQHYGQTDGFPSDILINVFEMGNQLVFPAAYGVFNYDQSTDSFVHNNELETLISPDIHISELEYNYNGNLFFLSNEELGFLKQNSFGEYEKHTNEFVRIRKLLSDDLENITVLDHENVLLGAKEGFIHYNPNMPYNRDQPLEVYIRKIESVTDEYSLDYNGAGNLSDIGSAIYPANFASLKFTYASPYFDGQDELTFQYKLEGFDKTWSAWSSINDKEYTNLNQGQYIFKVRVKNVFGTISEPAVFKFRVFPPWYKSKLAYASYVLLAILIFFTSMYWQSRRHKFDKEMLTMTQQKELKEKDSQIEQVSKESEAQITRLRNDKLRAEIDHKNRELATTTMHLINKNEFMLNVRDTMKELSKTSSKEGIKKLVKEIDRNLAEDEGWEQFTRHFDQVHGDFLKNVRKDHPTLTPQEIKLCAYLRMNMSSKEIANLLNISVRGVEISRYRLRKKLNISRETNLVEYMMGY